MSETLSPCFHSIESMRFSLTTLAVRRVKAARWETVTCVERWVNVFDPPNLTLHTVRSTANTKHNVGSWLWFYSCSGYHPNRTYHIFPVARKFNETKAFCMLSSIKLHVLNGPLHKYQWGKSVSFVILINRSK